MAKIVLPVVNQPANPFGTAILNENFQKIAVALENTVSRDGTLPNQMEADLDLNNNDLLNVGSIDAEDITVDGVSLTESVQAAIDASILAVDALEEIEAIAGDIIAQGNVPIYDNRALASTYNLTNQSVVEITRWSASSPVAPAKYAKVAQPGNVEPTHAGKFQSDDGAWWEVSRISPDPAQYGIAPAIPAATNSTQFTALEGVMSGILVNMNGMTLPVSSIPIGNTYFNGFWDVGGTIYPSDNTPAMISDAADTGGVGSPYAGGTGWVTDIPNTRSTRRRTSLIASQNSRAGRDGASVLASIYSYAAGNRSLAAAARQSQATSPQSAVIATEECEVVEGFQGAVISSQFTTVTGSSSWAMGTDECYASGAQIGITNAYQSYAGRGGGFRGIATVTGGVITSVAILKGGRNYNPVDVMFASARTSPATTDAVFSYTVDANGTITSITVVNGGSGYVSGAVAIRITGAGSYSTLTASARSQINGGQYNQLTSSDNSKVAGTKNFMAGTDFGEITSAADQSVMLAGLYSQNTQDRQLTLGKRVLNAVADSFVIGGGSSGTTPLSSNRTYQTGFNTGNTQSAGTFIGSAPFTDYAEFFENVRRGLIELGVLVTLEGRKVRPARDGDEIVGVVSGTALIVAGDSPLAWSGYQLTGKFGEPLFDHIPDPDWKELIPDPTWTPTGRQVAPLVANPKPQPTIKVRRVNPDFDETLVNVPRSERPEEWTCVALIGQVHVRVDQTVQVGQYIEAGSDGVGHASERKTNMLCMEIRSPFNAADGYAIAFCLLR